MKKNKKISWKKFEIDIKKLIKLIPERRFTKILAISKGGLIPAYYIAKYLNIKYIKTFCVSSYNNENEKKKLRILHLQEEKDIRKNWLIIDDLVDSGETLELAKRFYPFSKTAVLYSKKHSSIKADYCLKEMDGWIVFPWEK